MAAGTRTAVRDGSGFPASGAVASLSKNSMSDAIRTEKLSKNFGEFEAVADVSLNVAPNEIYGFLGPNGAGKTTTIMMLLGLERPSRGEAFLLGSPAAARDFRTRRNLGVLAERQVFYDDMTAREYLRFFGRLYQVPSLEKRIEHLLDQVNLLHGADARARDFSRGMQQKLGLARALLHDPDLLILDEPVSALDPKGVVEIRELLFTEVTRGKTIFISSHVLTEVEQLAHRIGIMNKGRLVAEDSLDNIRGALQPNAFVRIEVVGLPEVNLERIRELTCVRDVRADGNRLSVELAGRATVEAKTDLAHTVIQQGGVIIDMQTEEMSLEEAFVSITDSHVNLLMET